MEPMALGMSGKNSTSWATSLAHEFFLNKLFEGLLLTNWEMNKAIDKRTKCEQIQWGEKERKERV